MPDPDLNAGSTPAPRDAHRQAMGHARSRACRRAKRLLA